MKINQFKLIEINETHTLFELNYTNAWGNIKIRKGFHKKNSSLCYWLDTNDIIYGHSDSILAILSTGKDEFQIK